MLWKILCVLDKDNVIFSTAINIILEEYKHHPSVTCNMNKAMVEYQTPLELIKTAGNILVEPLKDIINSCFNTSTFHYLAKRVSVTPIKKGGTDKHTYTNHGPVRVLNTFLKNNRIINI